MADAKDLVASTIELPIQRAFVRVTMKPHQVRRDVRRGGKTSHAAARLAHYRLRKMLNAEGWAPVDDIQLTAGTASDDFIRNQRTVGAFLRCVDRLELDNLGIGAIRVPRSSSMLVLPVLTDAPRPAS